MQASLTAFLERAGLFLDRLEPMLPPRVCAIDWQSCLAARWQRQGAHGWLKPLRIDSGLQLDDLLGIERPRDLLLANTRQFVAGMPADHDLPLGARSNGNTSLV